MPVWVAGVVLGALGAVLTMLYRTIDGRVDALEKRAARTDDRHTETSADLAEGRANHAALKETIDKLTAVVDKLGDAVSALRVR